VKGSEFGAELEFNVIYEKRRDHWPRSEVNAPEL
jgi:hypothetical protein